MYHQLNMSVVLKSNPSIKEDIIWGNLTFISNGNIAAIYTYDTVDYINLAFFRGTGLSDPKKLLEGKGKAMRHLKIRNEKDIDEERITKWVKEVADLNLKKESS